MEKLYKNIKEKRKTKDRGKEVYVESIKVKGITKRKTPFNYHLILACVYKKGKDSYVESWRYLKTQIEKQTSKAVDAAIRVLRGEYSELTFFLPRKSRSLDDFI